jgi:hypothetical protein
MRSLHTGLSAHAAERALTGALRVADREQAGKLYGRFDTERLYVL